MNPDHSPVWAAHRAYRAGLLRFDDMGQAIYDEDGLLVVSKEGRVIAAGAFHALRSRFEGIQIQHDKGCLIAPGFVDLHIHYPQTDVIGCPAPGLLPWLERYTFPEEAKFVDAQYAASGAAFFVAELLRHGVTTALTFATSHVASVNAIFQAADHAGLRIITGKCMQDRNCPEGVRDVAEQSLLDTEQLIQRWHGKGLRGQLGYAITPRFAPTCSDAQMRGMGELAQRYGDVWIQSHVSENRDEVAWVRELYPQATSYLNVYEGFGLLRKRSVYAHCIHFDDADRALMLGQGAAAAVCPTSNFFLGSGQFDFARAQEQRLIYGLASDVGGGTSFSPFRTMLAAHDAARCSSSSGATPKQGISLAPEHLWWMHTAGGARALGLEGVVGNLQVGCDADFVVLNPQATPLLARRTARANSLNELLFALIVLADDRAVVRTHVAGALP